MNGEDINHTREWWSQLLADKPRMDRWLQKLQITEYNGFQDNLDARDRWAGDDDVAAQIFWATGQDELRHAYMLTAVLNERGVRAAETGSILPSVYWDEMEVGITSLETCAAVFHLGETLAAERFEILLCHGGTPAGIKEFLERALPDEQHHARIYRKLTTDDAIAHVTGLHHRAIALIKGAGS